MKNKIGLDYYALGNRDSLENISEYPYVQCLKVKIINKNRRIH